MKRGIPIFLKYLKLKKSDVQISFPRVLGMFLRRSLTKDMLETLILSRDNNKFTVDMLEAQLLAGGNPKAVVQASEILDAKGIHYEVERLLLFDIARENKVIPLVKSFIKAHEKYPGIILRDFIIKYIDGTDVIDMVEQGTFAP